MINVVLVEPEIPANTGNIVRTCAATGAVLHLVKPLGFSLEDKYLKRAGLDYWDFAEVKIHEGLDEFLKNTSGEYYFASTKSAKNYCDIAYPEDVYVLFGKETKGLPEELLRAYYEKCIRIPMREGTRSLNLSNSAAVIVYEYLRQRDFCGLAEKGSLT